MKIKAYELKSLVEKNKYAAYLIYGQNKGLVREKSQVIIDAVSYTHLTLPTNREV